MILSVFTNVLKEWAEVTTAHGIPNIVRAKSRILQLIWLIFFLTSLSYCTYQIIMAVFSFLSFEVVSNYNLISQVPTRFPRVDICNLNSYDGVYIRALIESIADEKNLTHNEKKYLYYIDKVDADVDQFKSSIEQMSEYNLTDLVYNSFLLEQMLISCRFQGKPCHLENFTSYHNFHYGNCFSFNSGFDRSGKPLEVLESKQPGQRFGLQLELYISDPKRQQQYSYLSGARVIVDNQSVELFPDEDGIDVPTGFQTNLAVSRTFINHLPYPYSDCVYEINEKNTHNKILQLINQYFNKTVYSQKFCMKICTQKYMIENCACFDYSLPKLRINKDSNNNGSKAVNGCSSVAEVECLDEKYVDFFDRGKVDECNQNCPAECNIGIFNNEISLATYPTEWYSQGFINSSNFQNILNENDLTERDIDYEYLRKTTLMLNVYYAELGYISITESPVLTFENLMAFIGGNFGLFLGISVLSVIEIFEVLFYLIYQFIKMKLEREENKVLPFNCKRI